jgi:hypothetical protein
MNSSPANYPPSADNPDKRPYESPELVELGELGELVGYDVSVRVP